ncbi:MAG: DUF3883 domain-containing protein [Candidatus Pacebacteria bacterium]|nr:DUF3883 domain-containing protein [Candidatus Paceibacterota bacterium]
MKNLYKTPKEYYLRHAFPRGRMLSQIEDDLLIFSQLIMSLRGLSKKEFEEKFDKEYTKLRDLKPKTIKNHRTEMISLFGLTFFNDEGKVEISDRAKILIEQQDFQLFFKTFCNRFQFPNAINKSQETIKQLKNGVNFKPAKFILTLLKCGNDKFGKFSVNGAEISNLIFNDLRVTRGEISPDNLLNTLVGMHKGKIRFESNSRQAQHGREFLGYMYLAGLLETDDSHKSFYLNEKEMPSVDFIILNEQFFNIPNNYIEQSDVRKETNYEWQYWFGEVSRVEMIKLGYSLETIEDIEKKTVGELTDEEKKLAEPTKISKKDIGDVGEKIVFKYERNVIKKIRPDKLGLVKIVANDTSLGYDIQSLKKEDVAKKKLIEVKTTIRTFEPNTAVVTYFPMSGNEWQTAQNNRDSYYIYRVFLSKKNAKILVIKDPFGESEEGNIIAEPIEYRIIIKDGVGKYLPEMTI